jgi:hypothetical protein
MRVVGNSLPIAQVARELGINAPERAGSRVN